MKYEVDLLAIITTILTRNKIRDFALYYVNYSTGILPIPHIATYYILYCTLNM